VTRQNSEFEIRDARLKSIEALEKFEREIKEMAALKKLSEIFWSYVDPSRISKGEFELISEIMRMFSTVSKQVDADMLKCGKAIFKWEELQAAQKESEMGSQT